MNRFLIALLVVFVTVTSYGCGSAPGKKGQDLLLTSRGDNKKVYFAHTIIFRRDKSPNVTENSFRSDMELSSGAGVKSYRFNNHFGNEENKNEIVVVLAIAGPRAGFGIYDNKGKMLAEYAKGKVIGNVVIFENKTDAGRTGARWYFGEKRIISTIDAYTPAGDLVYSEITTYTPK